MAARAMWKGRIRFGEVFKSLLIEGIEQREFPDQSVDIGAACIVGAKPGLERYPALAQPRVALTGHFGVGIFQRRHHALLPAQRVRQRIGALVDGAQVPIGLRDVDVRGAELGHLQGERVLLGDVPVDLEQQADTAFAGRLVHTFTREQHALCAADINRDGRLDLSRAQALQAQLVNLASDDARFITGVVLPVDAGMSAK